MRRKSGKVRRVFRKSNKSRRVIRKSNKSRKVLKGGNEHLPINEVQNTRSEEAGGASAGTNTGTGVLGRVKKKFSEITGFLVRLSPPPQMH